MELAVNIQIDDFFVLYKVRHVIDGIYIASLIKTATTEPVITPPPKKIFLHKGEDGWQSDHHEKRIGLRIGRKIDDELKVS
jgi:hypothetical protein